MHRLILALLMPLLAWFGPAQAQLTIEVTGGVEGAQPIAVVPFGASDGAIPGVDVAAVISADLARSGCFKPMPAGDMLATPHSPAEVDLRDWRLLGMQHLVVGNVSLVDGGFQIDYTLFDVYSGDQLIGDSLKTAAAGLRYTAHRIADAIYEKLTGQPGVFATRIAYVSDSGKGGGSPCGYATRTGTGPRPSSPPTSPSCPPPGPRTGSASPMSPSRTAGRPSMCRTSAAGGATWWPASPASTAPRPSRRMGARWP